MAVVDLALVVARVGLSQVVDSESPVAEGFIADDFVSFIVLKLNVSNLSSGLMWIDMGRFNLQCASN